MHEYQKALEAEKAVWSELKRRDSRQRDRAADLDRHLAHHRRYNDAFTGAISDGASIEDAHAIAAAQLSFDAVFKGEP